MNFLRRVRYFSTSYEKPPSPSTYFKENAQTIFTSAIILAGVFAAGAYSAQTAADLKVLNEKIKTIEKIRQSQLMALEEKIKTAKEEAKQEALQHLFSIINQAEDESEKKAIREKNNVK